MERLEVEFMRQTQKRLKEYGYCKRAKSNRDSEGNRTAAYEKVVPIRAQIWCSVDKLKVEMYGERSARILNMLYDGEVDIKKGDGICYKSTDKPDYKVIATYPYAIGFYELEEI